MIVDDASMLFMIVEHFEGGDPAPVYRRFAERGRMAPPGLEYHGSWVTDDLTRCYQVMECADRSLLEEWMKAWDDLVRFEVIEVMSSADAVAAVRDARLSPAQLPGGSQLWLLQSPADVLPQLSPERARAAQEPHDPHRSRPGGRRRARDRRVVSLARARQCPGEGAEPPLQHRHRPHRDARAADAGRVAGRRARRRWLRRAAAR